MSYGTITQAKIFDSFFIKDAGSMTHNNHKGSVLVIDDEPTNLNVLIDCLEGVNFEIFAAEDGESALEMLDYIDPDIILLDVMMPGMNGFETCRRLKENPQTKDIPVIFMTALSDTADKVQGFAAGAVDYVIKPIRYEEVLARISTHLTIRNLQLELQRANDELEERVADRTRRLKLIATLSRQLNELLDLEQLLKNLADQLKKSLGYQCVTIYLLEEESGDLVLTKGCGQHLAAPIARYSIGQGLVGQTAQTRQPSQSHRGAETANSGWTQLAVPLSKGGQLLGVLEVQSTSPDPFSPEDVSMLAAIADQASIAIDNARLLAEREETITQLEELDEAKTEFMNMISHELRTPMSVMLGFSELLLANLRGELPEPVRDDVQVVHKTGKHLLELINQVIYITEIEAGGLKLAPTPLEAHIVIHDVIANTQALMKERALELVLDMPAGLPPILADQSRLHQILVSLVKNAIKFSDDGGTVTLRANVTGNAVRFAVIDTGVGISPDKQQVIFEPFKQVDMSARREYGGIGLGLTLCKGLVELHGGEIGVTSTEGSGAEFYFTIPLAR
jgi:signal transduction histidine kinase/DNA-binding response OmpR family regulator